MDVQAAVDAGGRPGVLARCAGRRRVHRDPAVDPRPGAGRRRARGRDPPTTWWRRCAGWRTSWAVPLSSVLLAAHAKVLAALSGRARGHDRLRRRAGRPTVALPG